MECVEHLSGMSGGSSLHRYSRSMVECACGQRIVGRMVRTGERVLKVGQEETMRHLSLDLT